MKILCLISIIIAATSRAPAAENMKMISLPSGAVQPRVATDSAGTVHLIYFKGDPAGGDVFYEKMDAAKSQFGDPIRVNSEPGSAVAMGTIRGADLAIGKNNRVHVAWNPSQKSNSKGMYYARLNEQHSEFEPQKSVTTDHFGLDGGGSIAADARGNVYVVWHAPLNKNGDEGDRRVWVARSTDEGKTFAQETMAWNEPTGACGCCGLRAVADREGNLYVLYRSARDKVNRDMYLLTSKDQAATFTGEIVTPMKMAMCIMSAESLVAGGDDVLGAWESAGQVYWGQIDPANRAMIRKDAAPGSAKSRKYPAIAQNKQGQILLTWIEGAGWNKGGSLAWQMFDRDGRPIKGNAGRLEGIPAWSFAAAYVDHDDRFVLLH